MNYKPVYVISVVAEMLDLHPQTIRQYERVGLLKPSRTSGNKRRYSEEDVQLLRYVTKLTKDMGINIAGVEIIISMREQIYRLEQELEDLRRRLDSF